MKYYYYKVVFDGDHMIWINKTYKPITGRIMPPYICLKCIMDGNDKTNELKEYNPDIYKNWQKPYDWKKNGFRVEELSEEDSFIYLL